MTPAKADDFALHSATEGIRNAEIAGYQPPRQDELTTGEWEDLDQLSIDQLRLLADKLGIRKAATITQKRNLIHEIQSRR